MDLLRQLTRNTSSGLDFVADAQGDFPLTNRPVRIIAYYLPQFHPIPENDEWWGKGFTEWTNVTKALPRFVGHYQPQLPGGLGFYDLRVPDVLREQAKLARKYGIEAFCFHRYWFNGKTLLETPLNILLQNPDIDIGFCLNWANENWSRRWNGGNQEVLIGQEHSPEDDLAFAKSLEPFFRDPRYVRIDGRPLMMLYKPHLLSDPAATIARWREYFISVGIGNPYITMPQTSDCYDPRIFGFDAAAGFPPHLVGFSLPNVKDQFTLIDRDFNGIIASYELMAELAIKNAPEEFTLFPGVCPSWDNQARNSNAGFCFAGSSPAKYGAWLRAACQQAITANRVEERIVFINAWNEWAEGAYLEPNIKYGYAYLSATRSVLEGLSDEAGAPNTQRSLDSIQGELESAYEKMRRLPMQKRVLRKIANVLSSAFEEASKGLRSMASKL